MSLTPNTQTKCHGQDLNGRIFARLTVLSFSHRKGTHDHWNVLCACGTPRVCTAYDLIRGSTTSCGCQRGITNRKNFLERTSERPFRGKDWAGERFARLIVGRFAGMRRYGKHRTALWECVCECGGIITVPIGALQSGNTRSCGCLHIEGLKNIATKHGYKRPNDIHPLYWRWQGIIQRCTNPRHISWKNYGGRGITVCERWLNSFEAFLEDMLPTYVEDWTVERKDVNGNYCPDNCCWLPADKQGENTTRTRLWEYRGRQLTIKQLASETGANKTLLTNRLYSGWDAETAASRPKRVWPARM